MYPSDYAERTKLEVKFTI